MIEVRTATSPAPGRPVNEDAVFQIGDLVGVLDGVTLPPGFDSGCRHGTAWYVRQLVAALCEHYTAGPTEPLATLLRSAIRTVRELHPECDLDQPSTPAATVCLVRTGPAAVDYLVLCDTTLVIEVDGVVTAITDGRFREIIAELRRVPPDPTAGEAVGSNRGYTAGKWKRTNQPGGYWIAAATPEAADEAVTGQVPVGASRIALLTDGAAGAVDSLSIMTWRALLDVLTDQGADALVRRIRIAEAAHAETGEFTGKVHDDATTALLLFPTWAYRGNAAAGPHTPG
ncbi:MAG: hypothetical protein HOU81_18095 [Hamadaea sp.]|uniref:protein phosphatase 2C domain-containing protein n=1 Tax=Hamadaea sp. TaxID=2024425 RepID=UPI0017A86BE8|nr:protein phosphatase 2C domain-containing protein [Hamadaea sp.]NUR72728.1 hypothetical protein [Hamadaea sp.]NUT18438.1 hypothetical protein [Hamadaea sp.]